MLQIQRDMCIISSCSCEQTDYENIHDHDAALNHALAALIVGESSATPVGGKNNRSF